MYIILDLFCHLSDEHHVGYDTIGRVNSEC